MHGSTVGMILAAGFGTRLWPLTYLRPKPSIELHLKPMIYYALKIMQQAGIKDVIINCHYHHTRLIKSISELPDIPRVHMVYEKRILGTAGGVKNALNKFSVNNKNLLLINGDILCDVDLKKFKHKGQFCTLFCAKNIRLNGYKGSVKIKRNKDICVLGSYFNSKDSRVADEGFFTGISYLSKEAVKLIKENPNNDLVKEIYPQWLSEGRHIKGEITTMNYNDLGSCERVYRSNLDFFNHQESSMGKNIKISGDVRFVKPFLIGKNIVAKNGSVIGPYAVIGDNCYLDENCIIKNSVIMSKTKIKQNEMLDHIIASDDSRVLVKS